MPHSSFYLTYPLISRVWCFRCLIFFLNSGVLFRGVLFVEKIRQVWCLSSFTARRNSVFIGLFSTGRKSEIFEINCVIISFSKKDDSGLSVFIDLKNILSEVIFRWLSVNTENTESYLWGTRCSLDDLALPERSELLLFPGQFGLVRHTSLSGEILEERHII